MKKLRYIIGLVLILVAGVSFADPYHFNYTNSLLCKGADGKPVLCDISVQLLGQVFGQVGSGTGVGDLAGNGMLAMGWMFRVFNEGVCGVIGLFLAYGIFSFGLRSAHDGLQGESKKAGLALLRVVLGVSLILPQATGYSYMQRIVMETIVAGSGLATTIYQQVLGNMKSGAAELFHKVGAGSSSGSSGLTKDNIGTIMGAPATKFIRDVFRGEVCTAASNMYVQQVSGYISYAQSSAAQFMNTYQTVCAEKKTCDVNILEDNNPAYKKYCGKNPCTAPATADQASKVESTLTSYYQTRFPQGLGFQPSSMPATFAVQDHLDSTGTAPGSGPHVDFPGITFGPAGVKSNYDPSQYSTVCGSFSLPVDKSQAGGASAGPNYLVDPMRQIVESMQPLADRFVHAVLSKDLNDVKTYASVFGPDKFSPGTLLPPTQLNSKSGDGADISNQVTSSAIDLAQLMMPYLQQQSAHNKKLAQSDLSSFVDQASKAGWVTAGRYYFDMIRLNDYIQTVVSSAVTGSFPTPLVTVNASILSQGTGFDLDDSLNDVASSQDPSGPLSSKVLVKKVSDTAAGGASEQDPHDAANPTDKTGGQNKYDPGHYTGGDWDKIHKLTGGQLSTLTAAKNNLEHLWGDNSNLKGMFTDGFTSVYGPAGIGYLMMRPLTNALGNIAHFFDQVRNTNPVIVVHQLGMVILGQTLNALMVTNGVIFGAALVANLCNGEQPLGQATNMSINWVGGMVKMMVGPLLMAGGVCAYFVPLYPMLVFTFGVIGWLGAAIEAMIAMPLVCLGLTHPDGHDFAGKSEQAVMLLLGIFIRPAVMIFGMVAAMSVSYVAIRLLNIGFMGALVDGFGTGMSYQSNGSLHNAMLVSNSTMQIFGHSFNAGANSAPVSLDKSSIAGATGGVEVVGHAIMAAVNGAKYEKLAGGGNSTSMLAMVSIPCLFIVYALMVYEVITMSFGLVSEFVQAVLGWIGGPQMRDNSVQQAKGMQSGFTQPAEKIGGTMDDKIGRGGATTTTGVTGTISEIATGSSGKGGK